MRIVTLLLAATLGCDAPSSASPVTLPPAPGSITGVVRFSGIPTKLRIEEVMSPYVEIDRFKASSFQIGTAGELANVYVTVVSPVPGPVSTSGDPVYLDQIGLLYQPRVLGILKGQPLIVRNLDKGMHNIHFSPANNPAGNQGSPKKGDEATFLFPNAERGIKIKCDVHPWMIAWLHVSEHPYFSVTRSDGRFSIPGLPPGDYELLAWHERFPADPLKAKVRVEAGKTAILDFTFEAPKK